ncbi:MAG: NAD(P)-dependent oxidoreductase [Opitutae bacterium]|nr:NAD(P)-dependent oxidoreductase [Opitutae bacterium]
MKIKPEVGWIGLGVMGASMAGHLVKQGCSLLVHSRTRSKAAQLIQMGTEWIDSPSEVAGNVDYLFTMLGYPEDVEEVYFGRAGIFSNLSRGTTLIDMTTSTPELSQKISVYASERGCFSLDAPVSGGDIGAREARLAIMCGGNQQAYDKTLPLFQIMGKTINYFGESGSGQRTKMSNQILIASTMIGTVESLLYAEKANLDLNQVIEMIGQGAAGCWSLNHLGPRMLNQDWEPGFYVKHFVKDMGIALNDAKKMGIRLQGLELAHQFYKKVSQSGYEEKGTQVLLKVLKDLNNESLHA